MGRAAWSRRRFLGAAGVSAGWGLLSTRQAAWGQDRYPYPPVPSKQTPGDGGYPPPPTGLRVRQNINALSAPQLQALRDGVAAMKARPDSDPTSWSFQANIHGTFGPPSSPLFNQCQHGTIQFFTWHRGYLYFFERILRAASGDDSLTLPYWDWTGSPALPEPYRNPSDSSNPLFDGTRFINNGSSLPASVVSTDLDTALAFTQFENPPFVGFSPSLEGSPHGAVHVLIGGNMSQVPSAANDPIFWLHHGNIDRIWDRWLNQGGGRANPSDAAFLDQTYSYADVNGATVTLRVRDMIGSAQLGYKYDDTPNPVLPAMAMMTMTARGSQQPKLVASTAPTGGAAAPEAEKTLGFKDETVALHFAPQGQESLRAAATAADPKRPGTILIQIKGVRFAAPPAYTYEVLLNVPEGDVSDEQLRRHHVGTINFFQNHSGAGHGGQADGGVKTFDQTFDATRAIARLREAGLWNDQEVRVTLRPVTTKAPEGQEDEQRRRAEESAAKANISYQQIDLLISS